jgi:hypothetical protein
MGENANKYKLDFKYYLDEATATKLITESQVQKEESVNAFLIGFLR